jgi:hypothetical protein
MARRTLYPTLPGESAVGRLLNQTLPQLVKDRQASDERAQQRQDTLDARKQQQDNYEINRAYMMDKDAKEETRRQEDKLSAIYSEAGALARNGYLDAALTTLDRGDLVAKNKGLDPLEYGGVYQRESLMPKIDAKEAFDNAESTFINPNSSIDMIKSSVSDIYANWGDLNDNQKSSFRTIMESKKGSSNFAWYQAGQKDLAFIQNNSDDYHKYMGKDSGYNSLPQSQQDIIIGKIPQSVKGVDYRFEKPADAKYTAERDAILQQLYKGSDLYKKESANAQKYIDNTVNQYGGFKGLGEAIFSMDEYNQKLMFERVGKSLLISGAVKTKDSGAIEKYLTEQGFATKEQFDSLRPVQKVTPPPIPIKSKEEIRSDKKEAALKDYTVEVDGNIASAEKDFNRALELQKKLESSGAKDKNNKPIQVGTKEDVEEYNQLKKRFGFTRFSSSFDPSVRGYNQLFNYVESLKKEKAFYERNPSRLSVRKSGKGSVLRGILKGQDPSTQGRLGRLKGPGSEVTSTGATYNR